MKKLLEKSFRKTIEETKHEFTSVNCLFGATFSEMLPDLPDETFDLAVQVFEEILGYLPIEAKKCLCSFNAGNHSTSFINGKGACVWCLKEWNGK